MVTGRTGFIDRAKEARLVGHLVYNKTIYTLTELFEDDV
jgi:hypothetical protein